MPGMAVDALQLQCLQSTACYTICLHLMVCCTVGYANPAAAQAAAVVVVFVGSCVYAAWIVCNAAFWTLCTSAALLVHMLGWAGDGC